MNVQAQTIAEPLASAAPRGGKPRRVLFVAYAFPPVGGVSVQRVTKFVKYLPEFGWTSSVLTVANPSVPLFDESLTKEIPADTIIRRARTLEPGYALKSAVAKTQNADAQNITARVLATARTTARKAFNLVMQPDPQILWRPHALREGLKLLREVPHDAIVATGPPFSSMMLGVTLSKRSGVPLAVDFRDEWTMMTYWENKNFGNIESAVQARMQAHVLKAADLVIGTTPSTAHEMASLIADVKGHAQSEYVYNGFDASDYPRPSTLAERKDYGFGTDHFRMSFAGTLWNVTPIGPVVDGIIKLSQKAPDLASKLELVIAGRRTAAQEAELDRLASTPVKLVRLGFIPHKEAIALMCQSDALLLINADLPNANRLINAKTFEYMAARRPIFVVAPEGDLWNVLSDIPNTALARPSDIAKIAANLETAITRWRNNGTPDSDWDVSQYERRDLTGRLAGMLDTLVTSGAA